MKQIFTYILVLIILQSCDYFSMKKDNRKAVARVQETFLFEKDLADVLPNDYSKQDSILITSNYINNWIKQQLLISKAQINLNNNAAKFEALVKKYREDLYINSYKEAVVSEYLNTEITDTDIDDFYRENKENFKLNEELLSLRFIKIGQDLYNQKEIIKLFKSTKKEDLDSLTKMELTLKKHHLNESIWVKYSDFISQVPLFNTLDKKQLLKKGAFIQKEDSLSLYLVAIKDVLGRNEIAPKSYITPTIRQMILHQRKLLLLRNIEETLIDDARKEQQFEIY